MRDITPTGVEMEVLTAVSIAALNLYDMLKPHTDDAATTLLRGKIKIVK